MLQLFKKILGLAEKGELTEQEKQALKEEISKEIKETSLLSEEEAGNVAEQSSLAETQPQEDDNLVATQLHMNIVWKVMLTKAEKYAINFIHSELPKIPKGQLAVNGFEIKMEPSGMRCTAFIRNSTDKNIRIEDINMVLINNDQVIARQTFDLRDLGEIPALHSTPWDFTFRPESFLVDLNGLQIGKWKLAFELKRRMELALDIPDTWKKSMSPEQQQQLAEIAKKLPLPQPDTVNFTGIEATMDQEKNLRVVLMIQNATNKNMTIHQLPLFVRDNAGDIVATGVFEMGDFEVKAYTAKPWMFVFQPHLVKKDTPDFSRWVVYTQ